MSLIQQGIEKGLIFISEDEKQITYVHQKKKRNYTTPEEKVQAETFLKLILVYGYPVERIEQYVTVTMGASTKEADIIVYNDDALSEPHIIAECKKQDVSELEFEQAIEQGFAYCFATAKTIKYLWVTSGIKDRYFEVDKERKIKKDAPDIPRYGVKKLAKYKYVKGGFDYSTTEEREPGYGEQKYFELEKVSEEELTRRFKQAHQALWAGGELNPSEAFDELDKLIFCKIWDEKYAINKTKGQFEPRPDGEPYLFQIFSEATEEKTTNELYRRIKSIYAVGQKKDPEVFKDNIRLSATKVKTVVGYLEGINLNETDLDSKGRAFEAFMGAYFRGDFGQFFTPRPIVKFIVEVLPIDNNSRVLDTSCGSGGFLLYALDKVRAKADKFWKDYKTNPKHYLEHYNYWHPFAENNLFGIEINEQIARTAKMNMIIHDDGHTNVISMDGLLLADEIQKKSGNKEFKYNSFDFIITNPPFGSSIKQTERAYLHQYNLGNKDVSWLDTKNTGVKGRANQSTEVLFIEQCRNFLKPGGYLAIVIPDGVLTNSSMQYVRDSIEEWYRIVAVVSMPQTAFAHTGAGVKSSVLFLRKWSEEKTDKYQNLKKGLQEEIKTENDYLKIVETLEKEKKQILKEHAGFKNLTGETESKAIEKTDDFKEWKNEVSILYSQKLNDLKENLTDQYISQKQKRIDDYQIFMAIAEDIGYDATNKATGNNELQVIGKELTRFINQIEKVERI